jgi:uncharacterized protein (TIGR04255 family)
VRDPRPNTILKDAARRVWYDSAVGKPYPHLPRAPISEALIDFRFDPPFADTEKLAPLQDSLKDEFPEVKMILQVQGQLAVSNDPDSSAPPSKIEHKLIGHALWSADQHRVVQVRTDGFSFSHLKPYQDWAALRSGARSAWDRFLKVVSPDRIVRCAVRYINRIELPLPFERFEEFFSTFPQIGPELPQDMSGMYSRVVLPQLPAWIVVTQAIDEAGVTPSVVPVILDIDVFVQNMTFSAKGEEVWAQLDELRDLKNRIFFGSVTAKALELFR